MQVATIQHFLFFLNFDAPRQCELITVPRNIVFEPLSAGPHWHLLGADLLAILSRAGGTVTALSRSRACHGLRPIYLIKVLVALVVRLPRVRLAARRAFAVLLVTHASH